MSYAAQHLQETVQVVSGLDGEAMDRMAVALSDLRQRGGRLFLLGVGGSAASASHAVNDFRKLVGLEAYTPTDNVSELTARANDEGWATVLVEWLRGSRIGDKDAVLVLSVGGGSLEKNISPNIVTALQLAKDMGAKILGIVGRDGGLHGKGCRRLRAHSHRQSGEHHAAHRGVSRGDLAPPGVAPGREAIGYKVVDELRAPIDARAAAASRGQGAGTAP